MSKKVIKRLVAAEKFCSLTVDTDLSIFTEAGHTPLKIKIMEKAITPKSARAPVTKFEFTNILAEPGVPATWWRRRLSTETVSILTFRPPLCIGPHPIRDLFEELTAGLRVHFGRILPDKLIIDKLITQHDTTGTICTWKRQAFRDYEDKSVYRLVLYELNSVLADTISQKRKKDVADGMQLHFCVMKGKEHFTCAGLTK
jgi:hypothetical protein